MYSSWKIYSKKKRKQYLYHSFIYNGILLVIMVIVTLHIINIIVTNQMLTHIREEGINYDAFRELNLTEPAIAKIKKTSDNYDAPFTYKGKNKWDEYDRLTLYMLIYNYDIDKGTTIKKSNIDLFMESLKYDRNFQELKGYYFAILNDIESFPVTPKSNGDTNVSYEDSWNAHRGYGGNRRHEGTDLMGIENIRGHYPVISITEGVVEQLGWLEQGGYRIGIRSNSGAYFYYAHLDSYEEGIKKGDSVKAGQVLGYMGDSGYGSEGTKGKFDVHLHMGIYVDSPFGELSVNPYKVLLYLEKNENK